MAMFSCVGIACANLYMNWAKTLIFLALFRKKKASKKFGLSRLERSIVVSTAL